MNKEEIVNIYHDIIDSRIYLNNSIVDIEAIDRIINRIGDIEVTKRITDSMLSFLYTSLIKDRQNGSIFKYISNSRIFDRYIRRLIVNEQYSDEYNDAFHEYLFSNSSNQSSTQNVITMITGSSGRPKHSDTFSATYNEKYRWNFPHDIGIGDKIANMPTKVDYIPIVVITIIPLMVILYCMIKLFFQCASHVKRGENSYDQAQQSDLSSLTGASPELMKIRNNNYNHIQELDPSKLEPIRFNQDSIYKDQRKSK